MGIAVIRSFRSLATEMLDAADCPLSGKIGQSGHWFSQVWQRPKSRQSGQSAFVEATALSRLSLMTAFAVSFVPQSRHSRPMVRHRKHSVH